MAIVIAGAFIAVALYARGGIGAPSSAPAPTIQPNTQQAAATNPAEALVGNARAVTNEDHVRGPANAKLTILEYSDLECPFCKKFHTTLLDVMKEYPNDVKWVYRHFPLEQLHQQAPAEANAAECAAEQGKFWEFIDIVFATTEGNDSLDLKKLPDYARQAGVANITQFQSCVDSDKYMDKVNADVADAEGAGGRGTPYSILIAPDGKRYPINGAQNFQKLQAQIEGLLKS